MIFLRAFLFCFFLFSIQYASAQIDLLGLDRETVNTRLQALKKFWSKKKSYKLAKFEINERKIDSSDVLSRKYVDVDIILYRTPYYNTNHKYFFNEVGYVDSLIFTENACFDCAVIESGDSIRFSNTLWKKTHDNQFTSLYPYTLKKNFLDQVITCASATLTRIPKPEDGTCRKWIVKLSHQQSYDEYLSGIKNNAKNKKKSKS
jgi:hypothetical protein